MKQSASGGENPDLLQQQKEEEEAEEGGDDANVNIETNKFNENNNDMVVTIEEESNAFEYQETMTLVVENISSKKIGDQYIKLLIIYIFQKQYYFQQKM